MRVAVVSFRLGGPDGVSVEAAKWCAAFRRLGHDFYTVAGAGPVDRLVPGLDVRAPIPPSPAEVESALAAADVVVVDNLLSLTPLNRAAADAVAAALRGRPALIRHHDLPWQRPAFVGWRRPVDDDPCWVHTTINRRTAAELGERGIAAEVIYNAFDTDAAPGDRSATRAALGLQPADRLVLHPVRAIPRKNVAGAVDIARELRATYWLLGPAEDGYGPALTGILDRARRQGVRVVHGDAGTGATERVADAYAAADAVVLPSFWEGFGNATVESAIHRRPLAIGDYPVAAELAAFGFRWFDAADPSALARWLDQPDPALLDHNAEVARRHFSLAALDRRLADLLDGFPRR